MLFTTIGLAAQLSNFNPIPLWEVLALNMERENFYILLNLSTDPLEEDPQVIEAAIRNKQAEWSRYRSHPTRSLQCQRYIAMIPEIRRVMADANLRRMEAAGARRYELNRVAEKLAEIDQLLRIRMSKGFVSEEEIAVLAKDHGIPEDQLRSRVIELETEKLAQIDRQIELRMWKGYVAEKEVVRLAENFGALKSIIRSRIRCILVNAEPGKTPDVEPLDASLTRSIEKNLKIIGKESLYEFLELPSGADRETLQRQAEVKQGEMLKSAKKDALVTAGAELAGLCLSVFGKHEARLAYDVYRARNMLSRLDAAIEAAVEKGKIRRAYFESLIRSAADLGMDSENAAEYIRHYCRKKNWSIDASSKKRFGPRHYLAAAIGIAAIIAAAVFFFFNNSGDSQQRTFQTLTSRFEGAQSLEAKLDLLNDFLRRYPENRFVPDVMKMKSATLAQIEQNAFDETIKTSNALIEARDYEKAFEIMRGYLEKYPSGVLSEQVRRKIEETALLSDEEDYRELENLPSYGIERLQPMRKYLADHPTGKHRQEVEKRIADMHGEVLIALQQEASDFESRQAWENCVQTCDRFLKIYPQSPQAGLFKERRQSCARKLEAQTILDKLRQEADEKGNDFAAALHVYLDYLKAYPDFEFRDRVEVQIIQIQERLEQERIEQERQAVLGMLKQSSGRFSEKTPGVVSDAQTGLMWSLLDSDQELQRCLTYEEAVEYVKNIRTGGYADWRMPKAEELGQIYKKAPFFPSGQLRRYWTSQFYMRYADGWSRYVQVVSSDNETNWKPQQIESRQCCSVRVVRP